MSERYDMLKEQESRINQLRNVINRINEQADSYVDKIKELENINYVAGRSQKELRRERDRAVDAWNEILGINKQLVKNHDNATAIIELRDRTIKVLVQEIDDLKDRLDSARAAYRVSANTAQNLQLEAYKWKKRAEFAKKKFYDLQAKLKELLV